MLFIIGANKMINILVGKLVKFPIWKNDGKSAVRLNFLQRQSLKDFLNEIPQGRIRFEANFCLCGNTDESQDIVITDKRLLGKL
jgi:hypothetical protein